MTVGSQHAYLIVLASYPRQVVNFLDVTDMLGETPDSYNEKIVPQQQIVDDALRGDLNASDREELLFSRPISASAAMTYLSHMKFRARDAPGNLYLVRSPEYYTIHTLNDEIAGLEARGKLCPWLVGKDFYHRSDWPWSAI